MLIMNSVKKLAELAITKDDSDVNGFAPLMAHYMRCRMSNSASWEFSIKSPPPSHFDVFVKGEYFELLRYLLQILPEMIMDRPVEGTTEALKAVLKTMIARHQFTPETVDFFPYRQIVHLSFCTQATGWAVLMGLVGRKGLAWQFGGASKTDGPGDKGPGSGSSGGGKKSKKKVAVVQQDSDGCEKKENEVSFLLAYILRAGFRMRRKI